MGSKTKTKPQCVCMFSQSCCSRYETAVSIFIILSRQALPPCSSPPSRAIMMLWSSSSNLVPPLNSRRRYAAVHDDVRGKLYNACLSGRRLRCCHLGFLLACSSRVCLWQDGGTALTAASQYGHSKVVDTLLKNGANVHDRLKVSPIVKCTQCPSRWNPVRQVSADCWVRLWLTFVRISLCP